MFARDIIKSHPEEKWAWPWARGSPKNFGFTFNIFATAEASDFKYDSQLGFVKDHHKITRGRNRGTPGLDELLKIWWFPFNIYTGLKIATSNLVHSLGFPRPIIKLHP